MVQKLTEAYVVGLLTELETVARSLQETLKKARTRAAAVDAELSNLLRRMDSAQQVLADAKTQIGHSGFEVNEGNMRVASLHQEIAALQKKSADIKLEMDRVVDDPAIRRRLRRERAKLTVQIDDRGEEITATRELVEQHRQTLQTAERSQTEHRDRQAVLMSELDKLQGQLPSPYLYSRLFESLAARAHCRLFLDQDPQAWQRSLREAIGWALELHRELRAGKYRLDTNSELVGGRAVATVEAAYGAVALGDSRLATEIFTTATDPGLFFHQIFNIFRLWCLGLYLSKRTTELRELLRLHQFSEGLRGGYVGCFIGLLTRDPRRVAIGLKDLVRYEWELWQDPSLVRGAGVVNLGAVALSRLALDAGIAVHMPGPTVPDQIIAGSSGEVQA